MSTEKRRSHPRRRLRPARADGGVPLSPHQRAYFEPRFGRDFGQVRVHADAAAERSARGVNALAYTVGHDITFGAGQFAPETEVGRRLIAHELTHVVQGTGEAVRRQPAPGAQPAGPGAAYRLELANPLSDVEAHASTYELLPAFIGGLSRRYNFDENVGWRLFEWVISGLGFMTAMTYSHEQGGHGGEARRLGYDPEITLDAPWSGSACPVPLSGGRCVTPPGWTPDNQLTFSAAGMNQQSINASRMAS